MNVMNNNNGNFRHRRNFKKNSNHRNDRNDFRRQNNHGSNQSHGARHPELDIVIDGKAVKKASMMRDKYQALARDAQSAGDRVQAENYNQHADHYNRILLAANELRPQQSRSENGLEGDDAGEESTALENGASDSGSAETGNAAPMEAAPQAEAAAVSEEESFVAA